MKQVFLVLIFALSINSAPCQEPEKNAKIDHSETCPIDCKLCIDLIESGLDYLAECQQCDGTWEKAGGSFHAPAGLTALAFLAHGSTPTTGDYSYHVKRTFNHLVKLSLDKKWPKVMENWQLAFTGIFIAEIYKKEKSDDAKTVLENVRDRLLENRTKNGSWQHGVGSLAYKYSNLLVVTVFCAVALKEIKECGIDVEEEAFEKIFEYFKECKKDDGGFVYETKPHSSHATMKNSEVGRTAGVIFALNYLGLTEKDIFKDACKYFKQNLDMLPSGHGSSSLHLLFGSLASNALDQEHWTKYWWIFNPDNAWHRESRAWLPNKFDSPYKGTNFNNDDLRYANRLYTTATLLIAMQAPKQTLSIFKSNCKTE